MNNALIFVLLFAAIAIGWWLGRRGAYRPATTDNLPSSEYYQGLNYLLDGRPDGAVDAFIEALEVNSETLETHIALGNLLRKKGEVDRAIRVHQNLLARPSLPRRQVHLAHLELARDYISAGLLDRAERLLLDLEEESPEQRRVSQRHLLEIYQSERDWSRAIEVAGQLLPRKSLLGGNSTPGGADGRQSVSVALSHYCCESASERLERGELPAARQLLLDALAHDKNCVRASIMLGDVEYRAGHYKQAVKLLQKVRHQDPGFVVDTIATLRLCYEQLGDAKSLRGYLLDVLETHPSASLLLAAADDVQRADGEGAAAVFLSDHLAKRPSLRGLARLIRLQSGVTEGEARNNLGLLQLLVERLVEERPAYRCGHCGFAGRHLHWFCPGCKHWGTIKAIRGSGGE